MRRDAADAHLPCPLVSFAVRSIMKIVSASLVCVALTAVPAAAQAESPPTMSGAMTAPKPSAQSDEDDAAVKLRRCGDRWNRKLATYQAQLPKLKAYLAYYTKWESYPAQRPPKSPEPLLTRQSYRACMSECLGDTSVSCPGGGPPRRPIKE
jgi:hypothetical protein